MKKDEEWINAFFKCGALGVNFKKRIFKAARCWFTIHKLHQYLLKSLVLGSIVGKGKEISCSVLLDYKRSLKYPDY